MSARFLAISFLFGLLTGVGAYCNPAAAAATAVHDAARAKISSEYGRIPLSFEANRGQTEPEARFISRGPGYTLFLTAEEAVLSLKGDVSGRSNIESTVIRMRFIGAEPNVRIKGVDQLETKSNYFFGKERTNWLSNVPQFARVIYEDIYSGIDLVFYGNQRQLEYDFVVAPGSDVELIKVAYEGVDSLTISDDGSLVLHTKKGRLVQQKAFIYQEVNGERKRVDGAYQKLGDDRISFSVGNYDRSRPLVIDPVLVYSSYLGGSTLDFGNDIAVDSAGNAYITGSTGSVDFPTLTPLQPSPGSSGTVTGDAFVVKLNPQGNALVYSTYLGGSAADQGHGIAVDANGAAYIAGETLSTDFPVTAGAFQTNANGVSEAFVAKLAPDGAALVYSTYLGGNNLESGYDIAIDSAGNTYVTGITASRAQFGTPGFPTENPIRGPSFPLAGASSDAFVTKLNPAGSALVYSTYLGGSDFENINSFGTSIAVDSTGNAYVTGETRSTDFPTVIPLQPAFGGGTSDVFLAKLNPQGSGLVYSTYVGGSGDEGAGGIAVDSSANAYLAGSTTSSDFPTANPLQSAFAGGINDAFVAKLNAAGSAFVYSTYLGGAVSSDSASDIAVDAAGNAYVTGTTTSTDFPVVDSLRPRAKVSDAFVAKLNAAGSALIYSTFLGGNNANSGAGIAVDSAANVYVTGRTNSTDLSSAASAQPDFGGGLGDAFVAKLADDAGTVPPAAGALQFDMASYSSNEGAGAQTITVTRTGGSAGTVSVDFTTSDGTAAAGSDYTAGTTTLSFADGETSKTVSVVITDDTSSEGNETVNLALANPTGGATLGTATATLTIVDNDVAPQPPVQGDDSGGCAISPNAPFDPLLMLLALAASCSLVVRRGGSRRPQE